MTFGSLSPWDTSSATCLGVLGISHAVDYPLPLRTPLPMNSAQDAGCYLGSILPFLLGNRSFGFKFKNKDFTFETLATKFYD